MDPTLKELSKLEKATAPKGKAPLLLNTLDSLLQSLQETKQAFQNGTASEQDLRNLNATIEAKKKEVDDKQKEAYSALSRLGKALDRKFPPPLPTYPELFESGQSKLALERTIALHLLRTGQFEVAETFLSESDADIPPELQDKFIDLHQILKALRNEDIEPALSWTRNHQDFLRSRGSPLEFYLHRSQYMRLLLTAHPPNPLKAIDYAKQHFPPFYKDHETELRRLMACVVFLPLPRLQNSAYADLALPTLHFDLEPLFAKEYCASMGMSRQVPLRVVGDIGAGGALARIEKARKVMGDRKGDWSQMEELPIEIPVPPENRYHSIFACLVSKEQSTEANPPMMMTCGHVISKDSLQKLNKTGGRSKCPYCPVETALGSAERLYL